MTVALLGTVIQVNGEGPTSVVHLAMAIQASEVPLVTDAMLLFRRDRRVMAILANEGGLMIVGPLLSRREPRDMGIRALEDGLMNVVLRGTATPVSIVPLRCREVPERDD